MKLTDLLFKNRPKIKNENDPSKFVMVNGHEARFTPYGKDVYQSELIRAAINARATHVSKLTDRKSVV